MLTAALRAAWRFLLPAWRQAWMGLGLAVVFVSLALGAVVPQIPSTLSRLWLLLGAFSIVAVAARLLPAAINLPAARGFWAARKVELRLLTVAGLSLIFLFVLFLLVFVLVLCFAYAAAASGRGFNPAQIATWAPAVDNRGRIVVTLVAAAAFLGLGWAATRISLAAPATVEKGRVLVLTTWPITRGQGWRIGVANLAILVIPIALAWAIRIGPAVGGGRPHPLINALLCLAEGLVVAGLWLPLTIGLMGYFYRELSVDQTPKTSTFIP